MPIRGFHIAPVIALAGVLAAAECAAQWVPPKGMGQVSVTYQYTRITDHLFSVDLDGYVDPATGQQGGPGNRFYMGDVFGQTVDMSASYVPWRSLALTGGVAYVTSKYSGKYAESEIDDGTYHGSLQDATVTMQYMVPWMGFAITPSVGYTFPLRDYSTLGHSAVGSHLQEVPLGIGVGRSLSPLLPRGYIAGSYTYTFVENVEMYSLDQRSYTASMGYALSSSIWFGGMFEHAETIDGIDWATDITSEEAFHDHDVAAKEKYSRVGGHVGFGLGRGFSLSLSFMSTVSGENTHAGQSLTIIPTWGFGSRR